MPADPGRAIPLPQRLRHRGHAPNRKFTDGDVIDIRERHLAGVSKKALAREFGVHWKTIGDIVKGKTYKHSTSPSIPLHHRPPNKVQ